MKKNQQGFTLIETFIAITILLFAVMGPMSLVSRSIVDIGYAANQIVAFYLAQEGLELAINRRAQNEIENTSGETPYWLTGLEDCTTDDTGDKYCQISPDLNNLSVITEPCTPQSCEPLLIDENGLYNYDDGEESIFTRYLTIQKPQPEMVDGREDARVDVVIVWQDRNKAHTFTLSTLLTE